MRVIVMLYILIYCVLYDYFKYPNNFNGIKFNDRDWLQALSGLMLGALTLVSIFKYLSPRVSITKAVVFSASFLYISVWCLCIFEYDPDFTPPQGHIDESLIRTSNMDELLGLLKFVVGYLILPWLLAIHIKLSDLRKVIYLAAGVHLLWGVLQILYFLDIVPVGVFLIGVGGQLNEYTFNYVYGRSSGLLTNPFNYAFFLQLAALLAFFSYIYEKGRMHLFLFLAFLFGSLLSINRTTLALWIFFFSTLVFSFRNGNPRLKLCLFLIIGLVTINLAAFSGTIMSIIEHRLATDSSMNTRIEAYRNAFKILATHPFLGIGTGHGLITDSSIATILMERGIVGLIGWLAFWSSLIWVSMRKLSFNKLSKNDREVATVGSKTLFWMTVLILVGSILIGGAERHPVMLTIVLLCFIQCNSLSKQEGAESLRIMRTSETKVYRTRVNLT